MKRAVIENVHKKIDKIEITKMGFDSMRYHFCEVYRLLCENKFKKAREYLKMICNDFLDERIIEIDKKWKESKYDQPKEKTESLFELRKKVEDLNYIFKNMQNEIAEVLTKTEKENSKKLVNEIYEILTSNDLQDLTYSNENIDKEDVIELIKTITKKNNKLKRENEEYNNKIINLEKMNEINNQKELYNENVKLQETINKITEKNIKLKKECLLLSNELGSIRDSNKKKNIVIEKQKRIIDILTKKNVKSDFAFPIDDIKEKIDKLRLEVKNEKNDEIRNKKLNEMMDYERRLADFLMLNTREGNSK